MSDIWEKMQALKRDDTMEEEIKLYQGGIIDRRRDPESAEANENARWAKIATNVGSGEYTAKICDKDGNETPAVAITIYEITANPIAPVGEIFAISLDENSEYVFSMYTTHLTKALSHAGSGVYNVKFCDRAGAVGSHAQFTAKEQNLREDVPANSVMRGTYDRDQVEWIIRHLGFAEYSP